MKKERGKRNNKIKRALNEKKKKTNEEEWEVTRTRWKKGTKKG